ncbi:poly(3-hydroxybutyrate) depolymerase [uncultured Gammaproteobacteria bacterium]
MLYQMYDIQRMALQPMRLWAGFAQNTFRNPFLPATYTPFGRAIAAGAELVERSTRDFTKPSFGLHETVIDGDTVTVHERIVAHKPFCELRHFSRVTERTDPRVLIVAPMAGQYATLLRGTVEALLPDHDVYITDWIDARQVPRGCGRFDLDDYIAYVIEFLQLLGPNLHVLAVCQPSVPVLAAVALMAEAEDPCQPLSMTLIGGPIDPAAAPTMPSRAAAMHPIQWFEKTVITTVPFYYPGALRKVFPGFVQLSGFMTMNLDRHIGAHVDLFNHLVEGDGDSAAAHRKFYDEYLSVMDLPAEFYLQTVETVFQRQALAQGTMTWRGQPVNPAAISRTALMTVEGELDDISAPGQTIAAHKLCSGIPEQRRAHHLQEGTGHFGMFNGRRWREQVRPRLTAFFREQEG